MRLATCVLVFRTKFFFAVFRLLWRWACALGHGLASEGLATALVRWDMLVSHPSATHVILSACFLACHACMAVHLI